MADNGGFQGLPETADTGGGGTPAIRKSMCSMQYLYDNTTFTKMKIYIGHACTHGKLCSTNDYVSCEDISVWLYHNL